MGGGGILTAGTTFGGTVGVADEMGEAMGAVARVDRALPHHPGGIASTPVELQSFGMSPTHLRPRRRSVSLECSPLESIVEENNFLRGKITRKFSLPANNL